VGVVQRSFPIVRERCPKIERSPIRRRASKSQFQKDSGLPQRPADPSPGSLLMRQTACVRRSPSWYDRLRHPWEGAPCSALGGASSSR
jgi:hypothetical protein